MEDIEHISQRHIAMTAVNFHLGSGPF
jgi:hypothetical protein